VGLGSHQKDVFLQVFKPSPGLEPGTASLPWNSFGNWSQPTATDFACFRRFCTPSICR
jgi:hypothetical protein